MSPPSRGRRVAVVPHTHWDREWYSPFQAFRMRLVDMLDDFLPALEADLGYTHFLLDGQMAVVDDYLEVRPEAEPRIRRLVGSGRMAVGPWYTLPDEFLVSGETLVRDLQMGLGRAAAFGGAMQVGYLPDMFGHIAQMPQLLRLCGFEHAVVWRGVPAAVDRTAFMWSAPDGTAVRAEYLPFGYGIGAGIVDDAKALVERVAAIEAELGDALVGDLLFLNGTDHQRPQPWLGRVVEEANALQDDYDLVVTSLSEALATATTEDLPGWQGELRSSSRANLLMGVASNRVDVKQAAALAERRLERVAEPLAALFLPPDAWPASLLDIAWRDVVRNAAHDSICACSVDEVCDAVLHRYAEATQIADGVARRALWALGRTLDAPATLVVNPTCRVRGGLVELSLPGEGDVGRAQLLSARPHVLAEMTLEPDELDVILRQLRSQQLDDETFVNSVTIEEGDDGIDVTLHADETLRENLLVESVKADIRRRVADRVTAGTPATVRARVVQEPRRRVLCHVAAVPAFGWRRWEPADAEVDEVTAASDPPTLSNGLVTVVADTRSATFAIDGVGGFGRLVDVGDHGDTYNYSPPDVDTVVDAPETVDVRVAEAGPLRGRIVIDAECTWPERIDDAARARVGSRSVEVRTVLELRAGEPFVRVTTSFRNSCRDHRLRVHLPLPERAPSSTAECAFATVERGLTAEGGPTERGLPTFPSRRFVRAGGLTVVHDGLLEYELVDLDDAGTTAGELALTLLRATGMLSRVDLSYRPLPAGPPIAMEGPQMEGPVHLSYAVATAPVDPFAMADDVLVPLQVVHGRGGGSDERLAGTGLVVDGCEVSAVRRHAQAGLLEVRVYNPTDRPTTASFGDASGWLVDLQGRPQGRFDGDVPLRPWQIATVRLVAR